MNQPAAAASASAAAQEEQEKRAAQLEPQQQTRQLETILQLVADRSVGRATNEQVEAAIAAALGNSNNNNKSNETPATAEPARVSRKPEPKPARVSRKPAPKPAPTIQADTENYDSSDNVEEDDDEKEEYKEPPAASARSTRRSLRARSTATASTSTTKGSPPAAATTKRKKSLVTTQMQKAAKKALRQCYDAIPLGRQGASMMTTFGDGPKPQPPVVAAVLLGARRKLQVAIQDARAVRRKHRQVYLSARAALQADKPQKPAAATQSLWSSEIIYRATAGYDALTYDNKCGFDVEQLRQLFAEEMNAYHRWSEMRQAAADKKQAAEEAAAAAAEQASKKKNGNSVETATAANKDDGSIVDGHLQLRAAQFDVRTDHMEDDWYLKFAVVRQGSFLPAQSKLSPAEIQWNHTKTKSRGRPSAGVWAHMPAVHVRFLHWVGFDPSSALPPPNEETTSALGFLGYDFFGRIVEKAIFLRNLAKLKGNCLQVDEREVPLELEEGEQLETSDIERAMQDSDIRPVPLYGAVKKKLEPQLYFGPGFEERLEMELEEYVLTKFCWCFVNAISVDCNVLSPFYSLFLLE